MTPQEKKGNEKEVFSLYPSDGSFTIKTSKITIKKSKKKKKKKKDVKTELDNTRMDMIQ